MQISWQFFATALASEHCDVNGLAELQFLIRHFQCQGSWALCTADDDDELAVEEFHRWLLERFQTLGITVADGLERACTRYLEGELVVGMGDECTLGIGK